MTLLNTDYLTPVTDPYSISFCEYWWKKAKKEKIEGIPVVRLSQGQILFRDRDCWFIVKNK